MGPEVRSLPTELCNDLGRSSARQLEELLFGTGRLQGDGARLGLTDRSLGALVHGADDEQLLCAASGDTAVRTVPERVPLVGLG